MAKARFAKGLRVGSTKTETYSTLATQKQGRVQIIKDRVYDITNPQTDSQMIQRVAFATAATAAAKMSELVEISIEGQSNRSYARQAFISRNVEFLRSVAGRRVGTNLHYLAAFAPKGNKQIIPNSYIISQGSLTVPTNLVPKNAGGTSFSNAYWSVPNDVQVPFGTYTVAQLWEALYGLLPGDQLTAVQIYSDGEVAQALYQGSSEDSAVVDKTIVTGYAAPRIVLLSEMPTTTITLGSTAITDATIQEFLRSGISEADSYAGLVTNFLGALQVDDTADEQYNFAFSEYQQMYGVGDLAIRALGVILSRYDSTKAKWLYSTSQLACVWDFLANNSGADYFGFTLDNAIATHKASVTQTSSGNFLQAGTSDDILPTSFS